MLDSSWIKKITKVKLTFKNGKIFEAFGNDKITNVDTDMAMFDKGADSLFGVRSNKIWITLVDRENLFIKTNTLSEYYGYIEQGFKIEYYINVDDGGYVKCGEFYATDIPNSSSSKRSKLIEIQGADLLQYIGNSPVNILGIKKNITVKAFLEYIFKSVGLSSTRYNIDNTLDKELKYAYAYGVKLKDVLNDIAKSYECCIYIDEDGIIRVVDLPELAKKTVRDFDFDGDINVAETVLGTSLTTSYNAIRLNYSNPTEIPGYTLLSIDNIDIPPGTNTLSEFKYKDDNKASSIDYVTIKDVDGLVDVEINWISASQTRILVNVTNSSETNVKGSIIVRGTCIMENESVMQKYISNIDEDKRKYLEIHTKYIQDSYSANEYCDKILGFISADVNYVDIVGRANPLLKLGSIVGSKSNKLMFDSTCIVARIQRSVGSSVSFEITVLNSKSLLKG